jgi:hypothetical protein
LLAIPFDNIFYFDRHVTKVTKLNLFYLKRGIQNCEEKLIVVRFSFVDKITLGFYHVDQVQQKAFGFGNDVEI